MLFGWLVDISLLHDPDRLTTRWSPRTDGSGMRAGGVRIFNAIRPLGRDDGHASLECQQDLHI